MQQDGAVPTILRVDGGMVENSWLTQHLADVLQLPIDRPRVIETTALGAAYLAGLRADIFAELDDVAAKWQLEQRFEPVMPPETAAGLYEGWQSAVARVRS
jgi:glycerol kinase